MRLAADHDALDVANKVRSGVRSDLGALTGCCRLVSSRRAVLDGVLFPINQMSHMCPCNGKSLCHAFGSEIDVFRGNNWSLAM